jgi:hypothetical protein
LSASSIALSIVSSREGGKNDPFFHYEAKQALGPAWPSQDDSPVGFSLGHSLSI